MKNLKVGQKLLIGFSLLIALTMVVGYFGIDNMRKINDESDKMYENELMGLSYIKDANINLIYQGRAMRNYLLAQTVPGIDESEYLNSAQKFREDIKNKLEQARPLFFTDVGKAKLAEVDGAFKTYLEAQDKLITLAKIEQEKGLQQQDRQAVSFAMNDARKSSDEIDRLMDELANIKQDNAASASELTTDLYLTSRTLMISIIFISLILGIVIGIYITRGITLPLTRALQVANEIASGDMTAKIEVAGKDETAQVLSAMQKMVTKLSQVVGEIRSNAESLASASEEVSATAQSISQATSEQAASVEETSASIEQMTASINQNTENSKVTEEIASTAAKDANEGGKAVGQTVEAMKSIADKISIIDDIAYQTNLLALNAAIEAARAGEHGKGFAVVATEVRKLAERSQVAAQEIGEVAKSSVGLAEKAGKLLDDMVPNINKTSDLVQEITASSEEQSSGVIQVNTAMSQLNQVTQQNASSSEELAATSEEMSGQAEQLQELVRYFKLSENEIFKTEKVEKKPAKASKKAPNVEVKGSVDTMNEDLYVKF